MKDRETRQAFGPWLRDTRKGLGWSQQRLAQTLHYDPRTILRWEQGQSKPKSPQEYPRIAQALGAAPISSTTLILWAASPLPSDPHPSAPPPTRTVSQDQDHSLASDACQQRVDSPTTQLPLAGLWNIPYRRNPFFTGRQELLASLASTLQTQHSVALSQPHAFSGLGGVGKTQLALEYAYQYRADYQAIFWALADTSDSLRASYATIKNLLHLPKEEQPTETVQTVVRWLTTHPNWLLILDNADDLSIVSDFLPTVFNGHILLTTRAQSMGRLAQRIEVTSLEQKTGTLFLLRRAGLIAANARLEHAAAADVRVAEAIFHELDGLPLALDQAGAYIEETQCSLTQYLQRYQARRATLLARRGGLLADHPESVATTWSLSFQKVEQAHPTAAALLRLCAFLHPDAIPEEMIQRSVSQLDPLLQPLATDPILFDEAISELRRFSFIQRKNGQLSLHRLVQVVLRSWMTEDQQQQWAESVLRSLLINAPQERNIKNGKPLPNVGTSGKRQGRSKTFYQTSSGYGGDEKTRQNYEIHQEACASLLEPYQISDELCSFLTTSPVQLFIGALPFPATSAELRALFEPFGARDVEIITNRVTSRPMGFAFVTMPNWKKAHIAIQALHGTSLHGRAISVSHTSKDFLNRICMKCVT